MSIMERGKFFKETMVSEPRKGWHNLSFDNTFSMNAGQLYPTKRLEVFPGDTIHDKSSAMARLQPLVSPVMGKLNMFSYHFIVRNRDIWTQWDKFITNYDQKKTWQQNTSFVPPEMPFIDISEVLFGPIYVNGTPVDVSSLRNVIYVCNAWHNNSYQSYVTSSYAEAQKAFTGPAGRIFAVIPNIDDLSLCGGITRYYNPFCEKSLMEFLGVNIDGYYKSTFHNFLGLLAANANYHSSWTTDGIAWPWQFDEPGAIGNLALDSDLCAEFCPDLEWWEHHMVIGLAEQMQDVSVVAHWLADGTYTQSGTPTLTNAWPFPVPFKPSDKGEFDYKLTDLSLRAYRFIYDEYFRDENYIQVNGNTDFSRDGNDLDWSNVSYITIWEYLTFVRKSFEHDLYTSALPQAQRGQPVRFLPDANIVKSDDTISFGSTTSVNTARITSDGVLYTGAGSASQASGTYNVMKVDLSAATIENLRFINSMQRYLERKARTGGRYYEYMIGQWGYKIDDAKLNRPIYLGGDKTPVQISEVTQTSSSNVDTGQPLGDLAGRGVAIGQDNSIEFTAPDYGFLFELCAVVPRTSYGQGISPVFKRFNYMDYPLPDFANLGEEPIKKREIYATLLKGQDDSTFGYTARYYQFKYERDQIHGDMLTSLRHWNFARFFDSVPYNGKDFVEVDPSYRQFAVTDKNVDHFIVTMWHDIEIHRALPEISIPTL